MGKVDCWNLRVLVRTNTGRAGVSVSSLLWACQGVGTVRSRFNVS